MNNNNSPPRIAIWSAVSSKAQATDDKISLQDQEAAGREFTEAVDNHVVRTYTVPGHTRDLALWSEVEATIDPCRKDQ